MNVTKSISYKLSKNQLEQCKALDVNEKISFINQIIFEDSGINHNERLDFQYELLKISEINKSLFNSAYILNLISQTNAQMGNLELALDNLLNAEKKWREILSHNKNLNKGDYLIDDRPHNGAENFEGEWIKFGSKKYPDWKSVTKFLL